MNRNASRNTRSRALACVLFAIALTAGVRMSFAHTELVIATPAANSTVSAPKNVTITFSGALEPKFSKITVTDAAGKPAATEASTVGTDAKVMRVALPALAPGVYTVHWVAVSTDSHRAQGEYKFTVK